MGKQLESQFQVSGVYGWGNYYQENGKRVSTGLEGDVVNNAFGDILPMMYDYYSQMSKEDRFNLVDNADFFNGKNLMAAMQNNAMYYDAQAGKYTDAGISKLANYLRTGLDNLEDEELSKSTALTDISEKEYEMDPDSFKAYLAGLSQKELSTIMGEADRIGIQRDREGHIDEGDWWNPFDSTYVPDGIVGTNDRAILNAFENFINGEASLDLSAAKNQLAVEESGLGSGVLAGLGFKDENGRRSLESYSDVDTCLFDYIGGEYYCRTLSGEFIDCQTGQKIK